MTDIREMAGGFDPLSDSKDETRLRLLEMQGEVGSAMLRLHQDAAPIQLTLLEEPDYVPSDLATVIDPWNMTAGAVFQYWNRPDSYGLYNPFIDDDPADTLGQINQHHFRQPPVNTTLMGILNGQSGPGEYSLPPLFFLKDQTGTGAVRVYSTAMGLSVVEYATENTRRLKRSADWAIAVPEDVWKRAELLRDKLNTSREHGDALFARTLIDRDTSMEVEDFATLEKIFEILEEIAQTTHYHGSPLGNAVLYGDRGSFNFSFWVSRLDKPEYYRLAAAITRVKHAKDISKNYIKFQADFRYRDDLFQRVVTLMFAKFVQNHCSDSKYRDLFLSYIFQRNWDENHRRVLITADLHDINKQSTIRFDLSP